MMAERQVVIVKEAQDLSRAILAQSDKNKNTLEAYAENPQPTTVLVFCYKYKKLDKRKKVYKAISKSGLIFESKKLYENQVGDWIRRVMTGKGYTVEPKAAHMLVEFLGTADVKSKGVGAYNIPQGDLLKELLVQIMA